MALQPSDICAQILSLDKSLRFAAIADKMGNVAASEFHEGVISLLTNDEIEDSTIKSVLRMRTREDHESKFGKSIYTFTLYEKIKRASIPLDHRDYVLLIVSFEIKANHETIILHKILPLLRKVGLFSAA